MGTSGSADSIELVGLATSCGAEIHELADATEIRAKWLSGAATIGLAVASSARPYLSEEVIRAVSGLGPVSVVRRDVATEIAKVN